MTNAYQALAARIRDEGIEFVDLRAVDLLGRFRHVTLPAARLTEEVATQGVGFDGSNYGYRSVSHSDMVLVPDLATAYVEQRDGERIVALIGDIVEADTRATATCDPRGTVHRAERYLRECGVADDFMVSPEFEFYVFEQALFESEAGRSAVEVLPFEGREHRSRPALGTSSESAYHAPLPRDRLFGLRNEITRQVEAAGIPVKYHHHEVGPFGQVEVELGFAPLLRMADATLIIKHIVRNVAHEAGLTATFLPKPIFGEAGSGLHLHQYLVRDGRNQFRGDRWLSELAIRFVGGLLTHGRSLSGFTNPSTNSYRRLLPGYEAPVYLVYGAANRNAAVRVPAYAHGESLRIELRTMDAMCNPYLAFAAILMAGIDGVRRGLNANDLGFGPYDQGATWEKGSVPITPRTLHEALDALAADHDYLTAGGVFDEAEIMHWIAVKRGEAAAVAERPHPHEFTMYYDL
jgi:glutamine synthetase